MRNVGLMVTILLMRFASQLGFSRRVSKKVIVLFTGSSALCSFTCEELLQAEFLKIQENLNLDITNQAPNL